MMLTEFSGFDNPLARLLAKSYGGLRRADRLRKRLVPHVRPSLPTVSIGGITVGGAGKTPLTLYLAQRLKERGKKPVILSRGYLGHERGPAQVDPTGSAARFGDEALMCARAGFTVWVAKKRERGVRPACRHGDVLILDDGFQRSEIERDLDIVAFSQAGLGNGQMLPAGILRDDVRTLADADVFCGPAQGIPPLYPQIPRFLFDYQGLNLDPPLPRGTRIAALAAVAKPSRFFAALRASGFDLAHEFALPDHDPLLPSMQRDIQRTCSRVGIRHLVVTAKDAVKLSPRLGNVTVVIAHARYAPLPGEAPGGLLRFVVGRLGL